MDVHRGVGRGRRVGIPGISRYRPRISGISHLLLRWSYRALIRRSRLLGWGRVARLIVGIISRWIRLARRIRGERA